MAGAETSATLQHDDTGWADTYTTSRVGSHSMLLQWSATTPEGVAQPQQRVLLMEDKRCVVFVNPYWLGGGRGAGYACGKPQIIACFKRVFDAALHLRCVDYNQMVPSFGEPYKYLIHSSSCDHSVRRRLERVNMVDGSHTLRFRTRLSRLGFHHFCSRLGAVHNTAVHPELADEQDAAAFAYDFIKQSERDAMFVHDTYVPPPRMSR